ncbi:hypothetical protein SAMN05445504_2391 [Burkholderia sp. CF099]|nr:hypothetical protein SAMN05445504_2391 [Burkholderia sp. CF099]
MAAPLTPFLLACNLPRNAEFRLWVGYISVPPRIVSVDDAAEFIRAQCGIESRNELKANAAAISRLESRVRRPFIAWKERQHVAA